MAASYKGILATGTTKTPAHGARRVHYQGTIYTTVKTGTLTNLYAELPNIAAVYEDGRPIMDAYVEPTEAGLGNLVVVTESRNSNYIYEVEWQQIQKPIELHPRYNGSTYTLASIDWAHINAALAGQATTGDPTSTSGATMSVDVTAATSAGRNDAFIKMAVGQTNYLVFVPIARRIRIDFQILTVGKNLGTYSTSAPFSGAPSGYEWLKVTDRARKEGAYWERVEEWMGADSWDSDLYS